MKSSSAGEFASKRDPRLMAVLVGTAVLEGIAAAAVAVAAPPPRLVGLGVPAALLLSAAVILWCSVSTVYRVESDDLRIRCGPFRWRVAISTIRRVDVRRSVTAAPALSTERLVLECGPSGKIYEVSPERAEAFVMALMERNPAIVWAR